MSDTRQILTLNAGGASLKVALFDWPTERLVAEKYVDWSQKKTQEVHNHTEALDKLLRTLDLTPVSAVGHRVVHGGMAFRQSVRIDESVKAALEGLNEIAPLHNPPALELIQAAEQKLPHVPHVAAFDTTFHVTLPPAAYLYPLPYAWYTDWAIRRFGFHGLNLAYCVGRAAELLGKRVEDTKLVICHLGSGCSITATDGGRSRATTMGFTPLEGVMMATRSGSIDPGLLLYLLRQKQFSAEKLEDILNHEAGLKGMSGISGDVRDILAACAKGNEQAVLAFDLYTTRIREGIGMMLMHVGQIDALIFTDGVGEHSAEVRAAITLPLRWLGIVIDEIANAAAQPDADVATRDSIARVLVIHNGEELIIQRETRRILEH